MASGRVAVARRRGIELRAGAVAARLQFVDGKFFVAQHQIALDEVSQLAQVARPGISCAGVQHLRRKRQRRARVLLGKPRHEMLQQNRDLFPTLAQRWNGQRESIQAVIQIFAQTLVGEGFWEY